MSPENSADFSHEEEIASKKQEVVHLLDEIDSSLHDNHGSGVAISHNVSFLHRGEHFGLYIFKRSDGHLGQTRGVVLAAYKGDHPIPYYPPINRDIVIENKGKLTTDDDIEAEEVQELDVLNQQIGILRFLKEKLPDASYESEPLNELPDEVAEATEKLWNSEEMSYERARNEFFASATPIKEKARKVKVDPNRYKDLDEVVTRQTKWVRVAINGKPTQVRYQSYDAYSNGSWTDFERIVMKDESKGEERTYLEFGDISRDSFDFFGTHVKTARAVRQRINFLKDINAALEAQDTAKRK